MRDGYLHLLNKEDHTESEVKVNIEEYGRMKRRGVLGLLGGALAVGPSMAKQAVAAGVERMAIPTLPWDGLPSDPISWGGQAVNESYSHGDWLKKRISELTGLSAEERAERIAQTQVTQLDPDLSVNRSMALWAKVSEQKRRNFEIASRREHRNLTRELTSWLKDQALKN